MRIEPIDAHKQGNKSHKIITFSHLDSINVNDNFKDNFMREKVNKMASKVIKTLNICMLKPN